MKTECKDIIKLSKCTAPSTAPSTVPTIPPTSIITRITPPERELLLIQVAQMYQKYYDNNLIKAKVDVIHPCDRKFHKNANISISFHMLNKNIIFYHKAFFSTVNKNGNTWNYEANTTYGTHDSVSIHVVDNNQHLKLSFQYLMTSKNLQAYFPNASTNGRVYFEFPAINVYTNSNQFASHIDDFSVLFNHYLRYHEFYENSKNTAIAHPSNSLSNQAHII